MDAPVSKANQADDEVHLLDYLLVLAKHSRLIIYTSAAVAALTLLILLCIPNKYTATACLLPPQQNMTLSAQLLDSLGGSTLPSTSSGGLGGMAAGLLGLKSPGDLYVGMLTGNTIFDCIIERFQLRGLYNREYIEDVRKKLSKRTEISAGKDGLITIEVTDEDPQRAAAMANVFVEELDKLLQNMALQEARDRLVFLEKEQAQATLRLTKAEEALRAFSEKSSVIQIDAQTKGMIEYIASMRAAIDAKEVQLRVLRQQATPFNYDFIRLETELKGLKEKLREAEKEGDQTCIGDVCITTAKVPALGLEYLRLYREVKYQEALYQLYCKLVELARLDQVRDVSVVQTVDRAIPPEKKSSPKRLSITVLVGAATFFMMIFVAFGREYWQNTAQSESDAPRLAQMHNYTQQWRRDARRLFSYLKRKKP